MGAAVAACAPAGAWGAALGVLRGLDSRGLDATGVPLLPRDHSSAGRRNPLGFARVNDVEDRAVKFEGSTTLQAS